MVEPKPVVHFATFAELAGAVIAPSSYLSAFVRYSKLPNPDELVINCSIAGASEYDEIRLQLKTAYDIDLVDMCEACLARRGFVSDRNSGSARWPEKLPLVEVACGERRLKDVGIEIVAKLGEGKCGY